MSYELHYRGSSSYEDAVKNRLNVLEATGLATMHAIHENTNAIQEMTLGIRSDIRESTYALVASQAMLAQTFQYGFNAINNTLEFGFDMLSNKLDAMSDRICSKLDQIHDIVNNPLLTQSRELFRRALNNYNRGYYEEALEDCSGAVEKNKTDFISWNLLGHIYLFGAGKFSNVIAVDKAEEAFFNAAKYIDSDIGHSDEANILASEIYYYLGLARLIKSNDYLIENKSNESYEKLLEAEKASGNAYRLSSKNLFAGYEQAKDLHFLNRDSEALNILEKLIRADKNFALKASIDKNFESLWNQIDALILRLRDELANEIVSKSNIFYQISERMQKETSEQKEQLASINFPTKSQIDDFNSFYKTYFDFSKSYEKNKRYTRDFSDFLSDNEKQKLEKELKKEEVAVFERKSKFNELARTIAIEQKHYNEEQFARIYRDDNYIDVGRDLHKEKETLQKDLDKKKSEIENLNKLLEPFELIEKEDYFSVREKYSDFKKNENNGAFHLSTSDFASTWIKKLAEKAQCMQIYLDTTYLFKAYDNETLNSKKRLVKIKSFIFLLIAIVMGIFIVRGYVSSESYQTKQLFKAVRIGDITKAESCIKKGADINGRDKKGKYVRNLGFDRIFNETPLHFAIVSVNTDMVNFLIKTGADVNTADNLGQTPLHYLVRLNDRYAEEQKILLTVLMKAGASIDVKDKYGQAPFFHLVSCTKTPSALASMLIKRGADVNTQTNNNKTALIIATYYFRAEWVKFLIKAGAKVNARDNTGKSAIDYLSRSALAPRGYYPNDIANLQTLKNLLLEAGAK